jgi:hypothetical protein
VGFERLRYFFLAPSKLVPNFHDGRFNGIRLAANKEARLFLATADGQDFELELGGVRKLRLDGMKEGNIILDVVSRSELTASDIESLYGKDLDSSIAMPLLQTAQSEKLQTLEINPSYGVEALILFKTLNIEQISPQS